MKESNDDIFAVVAGMVDEFQSKKRRKGISERIARGRSRSSSDDFEELLARLFENRLPKAIHILVDYPISLKKIPGKKVKTIYPDITLVKDQSLIGIIEAKIDVGYLRGRWANARKATITQLITDGSVKIDDKEYLVPKSLHFGCILLSERNHKKRIPRLRKSVVNVFALITQNHVHPNDDSIIEQDAKAEYIASIASDGAASNEWQRLHNFIKALSA